MATEEEWQAVFKNRKIMGRTFFSREILEEASVAVLEGMFEDQIAVVFKARVPSENIFTETLEFDIPATWWQMFKRDHLPWLSKWFPVREVGPQKIKHTIEATYPKAPVVWPDASRSPLIFHETTIEEAERGGEDNVKDETEN